MDDNIPAETEPVVAEGPGTGNPGTMTKTLDDDNIMSPETPKKLNDLQVLSGSSGDRMIASSSPSRRDRSGRGRIICGALAFFAILVVVIVIVMRDPDEEPVDPIDPPVAVDFTTGVALVTFYGINATISSRLARTVLRMEVSNALDCSSIRGITFQLPLAARVASLKTLSNDGCETNGHVQTLEQARDTFLESAASGLPGAYVEERDSFTYSLQVTMPPLGTTRVELVLEELLKQREGEVEFQIPMAPNEKVDHVLLDIAVLDVSEENTNGTAFYMENLDLGSIGPVVNAVSTYHLDIPDARKYDLPTVLRGFYTPGNLPPSGVLYSDGVCFEHYFHPPALERMPRSIVFLMDMSESMDQGSKLQDAKRALKSLIDSLSDRDTLAIQTFAGRGTVDFWGSVPATDEAKVEAKSFVDTLSTGCCGTNLHEAYLEALLRAKSGADNDSEANILMVLSDGRPSVGEWDRAKIASDVWKLNQEGKVKLFSLGFADADLELLSAIAIMNGGVAGSIVNGNIDYASQMEAFFESEFGTVLLSDVQVKFASDEDSVYGVTQNFFPVLSEGTELVVRGLLERPKDFVPGSDMVLQAITAAMTAGGEEMTWTATATQDQGANFAELENSLCFQSYAHSRITRLLHLRDAARLLGDEVLEPVVTLAQPCKKNETWTFADCIEQEALSLSLEAKVVTKGLTGLVTVDDENCLAFQGETEICIDGMADDPYSWEKEYGYGNTGSNGGDGSYFDGRGDAMTWSSASAVKTMLWYLLVPAVILVSGLDFNK